MRNTFNKIKLESWVAIFNTNNVDGGRIVQKYNIISALIENYFISKAQLADFDLARSEQNMNAHKIFGKQIII